MSWTNSKEPPIPSNSPMCNLKNERSCTLYALCKDSKLSTKKMTSSTHWSDYWSWSYFDHWRLGKEYSMCPRRYRIREVNNKAYGPQVPRLDIIYKYTFFEHVPKYFPFPQTTKIFGISATDSGRWMRVNQLLPIRVCHPQLSPRAFSCVIPDFSYIHILDVASWLAHEQWSKSLYHSMK